MILLWYLHQEATIGPVNIGNPNEFTVKAMQTDPETCRNQTVVYNWMWGHWGLLKVAALGPLLRDPWSLKPLFDCSIRFKNTLFWMLFSCICFVLAICSLLQQELAEVVIELTGSKSNSS